MLRADQEFDQDDAFSPIYCVVCKEQIARGWSNANQGRCMNCRSQSVAPAQHSAGPPKGVRIGVIIWAVALGSIGICLVGTWMFSRAEEAVDEVSVQIDRLAEPPVERAVADAPAYSVGAERLAQTYDSNEVAANGQFLGRPVAVIGTIFSVDDAPLAVHLDGGGLLRGVVCEFTPDWRSRLASLGKGQQVRIVGVVKGKETFFVRMARCRIEP